MLTRGHAAWVFTLYLLFAATAAAHPPPFGRAVSTWGQGDDRTVAVLTNRGVVISRDDGRSWRFTCYEAIGYTASQRPPMALGDDGHLLLATYQGAVRSDETLCDYGLVAGPLEGNALLAMTGDPGDAAAFYATTGVAGADNGLYRSSDNGQQWTLVGASSDQWVYERVVVARDNPQRIYASGLDAQFAQFVDRSDDGGLSWTRQPFTLQDGELSAFALAVDPSDADRLFVHVLSRDGFVMPDRLVRSDDGGATWESVLTIDGLKDFAITPDGSTAWVGGAGGLLRSDDGGLTFAKVEGLEAISCLAHIDGVLWVCGQYSETDLGVVTSTDGGETFEVALDFHDVDAVLPCAPDTGVARECDVPFAEWQAEVLGLVDDDDAGMPKVIDTGVVDTAGDGGLVFVDGGATPVPDAGGDDGGGCGCRLQRSAAGGPATAVFAGLLALRWLRRRRVL